jgi:putative ABC transport system ATP-binding protein
VLEANGITKTFVEGRQPVEVLRGVSLAVRAGEIVSLEGPSGSGKSTLLSILGCILTPTSGEVIVSGRRVTERDLATIRRTSIGFIFQQYNLFASLTARENVEFALGLRGIRGKEAAAIAARALEAVQLGDRMGFLPRDLSGGQKQRVAIARALAGGTPIVLADEPTANLDTRVGGEVLRLFRELAASRTAVLIVTHDPRVRSICDRVLYIRDGLLQAQSE